MSGGEDVARAVQLFGEKFPSPTSGASTANIAFYKITPTALQFMDNAGARAELSGDDFGIDFHRQEVL